MSTEMRDYDLILFDRDGTLTEPASGEEFPKSVNDQKWIEGRLARLNELRRQGKHMAIVSNQGGAAWGIFKPDTVCEALTRQCDESGIGAFFVCFHDTSEKARNSPRTIKGLTGDDDYQGHAARYLGYHRRKPSPGMLMEAMDSFAVSREQTLMVGDREEDKLAAENAGCDFAWSWDFFKEGPIIV